MAAPACFLQRHAFGLMKCRCCIRDPVCRHGLASFWGEPCTEFARRIVLLAQSTYEQCAACTRNRTNDAYALPMLLRQEACQEDIDAVCQVLPLKCGGRAAFDPCGGKHEHQPSRVRHSCREVQDRRRHQRASDVGTHSCAAELQFLKPAILQNVWCEELMESCLSADAWPKRGPLLSEMGPGRASGDVLDDQTATRGMMHPRSTGAAAETPSAAAGAMRPSARSAAGPCWRTARACASGRSRRMWPAGCVPGPSGCTLSCLSVQDSGSSAPRRNIGR